MSYNMSIASYKAGTPLSAIWCFHFYFAISSIFLEVIQLRPTFSFSSACHFYPSLLYFPQKRVYKAIPLPISVQHFFIFHTIGTTYLRRPSPAQHFKNFQVFLIYFLNCPNYSTIQTCPPNAALYCAWFQASFAKYMRTALFWGITQRVVLISYRRFGTTYRSHLQGSRI